MREPVQSLSSVRRAGNIIETIMKLLYLFGTSSVIAATLYLCLWIVIKGHFQTALLTFLRDSNEHVVEILAMTIGVVGICLKTLHQIASRLYVYEALTVGQIALVFMLKNPQGLYFHIAFSAVLSLWRIGTVLRRDIPASPPRQG